MFATGDVQSEDRTVYVTPFLEFEPGVVWRDLEEVSKDWDSCKVLVRTGISTQGIVFTWRSWNRFATFPLLAADNEDEAQGQKHQCPSCDWYHCCGEVSVISRDRFKVSHRTDWDEMILDREYIYGWVPSH